MFVLSRVYLKFAEHVVELAEFHHPVSVFVGLDEILEDLRVGFTWDLFHF